MKSTEKNTSLSSYKKAKLLAIPLLIGALSVSVTDSVLAAFEPFRNSHETLEDDFDDGALDPKWTRLFGTAEGTGVDRWPTIDETTNPGELTIVPDANAWWEGRIGGFLYQDISGHFVTTLDVTANDLTDTGVPSTFVNSAGLLLRKPTVTAGAPGNEDYLLLTTGRVDDTANPGSWELNNKITDDSTPTYMPEPGWQNTEIRLAHYGPYTLMYARDASLGGAWSAFDSYEFGDMGSTIQLGLVAEADFLSTSGLAPVIYNAGPVVGAPDLTAKFDSFAVNNTATIGGEIITLINTLGVTGFANVDGAKGFIAAVHGITLDQSGAGQDHTVANTDVCYFDSGNVGTMNAYNNDAGTIGRLDADLFLHEASRSINVDSVVEMKGVAIPDNSFLCWGNDDVAFTTTAAQTPATVDTRLGRSWKVQHTNDVGNVTLQFDLTGLNFGNDISIDKFTLLLDSVDADFSDATVINPTSVSDGKVHFSNVAFPAGGTTYSFFTLGVGNSVVHNGSVSATVEINDGSANAPALADSDYFGASIAAPGDTNADNIPDVLVGAPGDDTGGADSGAFYIAPLTAGGALSGAPTKIDSGTANAPAISAGDLFGSSLANMGDLDWNGTIDIVAGAPGDDAGGTDRGAVHIMYMNDNETIASSLTIDSNTTGGPTLSDGDGMGYAVANVGDINGDWVPDLVVTSPTFDGNGADEGAAWLMFLHCDGSLDSTVSIDGATGVTLTDGDAYGSSVSSIGDLNADGVPDIAIGAINDGTGGAASGAVHILFMNSNGTIASTAKIDSTTANMTRIAPGGQFGSSIANMGDLDGDGVPDLAVGNGNFKGLGTSRGGYHIIYMNANGSVKSAVAIEEGTANVPAALDGDQLGTSVVALGDLDADGFTDMAIGSSMVDGGGVDRGEFHVSFLDNVAYPVVTDAGITVNTGSGAGGQFLTGDVLNVQWDTTIDIQPAALVGNPTVNLTEFGGGAAVALLDDGLSGDGAALDGIYGVNYTIVAGVINTTGLNVYVSATNANGTTGEIVDCTDASLDNVTPVVVVTPPVVVVTPPTSSGGGGGGSSAGTACFGLSSEQCRNKINPPVAEEPEEVDPPEEIDEPDTPKTPAPTPGEKKDPDPEDPLAECKIRHFKRDKNEIPRMEILPLTGITIPRLLIEKYDAFSIFEDMTINDPYYRSLYEMYAQGVMYFPGGKTIAKPNDFVRRSDAVQQILKGAEKSIEIECPKDIFLDVPSFGGFADYINNAFEFGIVSGYKGGYFKPLEKLNFAELSKIMAIAFDLNPQEQNGGHWADPYIQALVDQNLLPDGFDAKGQYGRLITRGELAEFIFRATKMQDDQKQRYLESMNLEVPKYDLNLTATRSSIEHAGVWLEDLTSVGAAFYNDIRGDKVVPVVWGHSSVWPFDPTPVGAAFRPLVDADNQGLVEGDVFSLVVDGNDKEYEVVRRQYVEAADIALFEELSDQADALIFTCDFPDFAAGRWVFVGKEI